MKVNQQKSQLLCISASKHDQVHSYIRPRIGLEAVETVSGDNLKIIGFSFNGDPTVNFHVQKMIEKFRPCFWSLRRLKKTGMPKEDLLFIYQTTIRPIAEFACVTFGPMLSIELTKAVECLQLVAFKIIFGTYVSYRTAIETYDLETLEERRYKRIRKFAEKTVLQTRYKHWFPLNPPTQYNIRNPKKYYEAPARTRDFIIAQYFL